MGVIDNFYKFLYFGAESGSPFAFPIKIILANTFIIKLIVVLMGMFVLDFGRNVSSV